ncbi:IS110 family transposase [Ruegeria marisflavi]
MSRSGWLRLGLRSTTVFLLNHTAEKTGYDRYPIYRFDRPGRHRHFQASPRGADPDLRPFGLKVGRVAARDFEARVRELVEGHPNLELCMSALLRGRAEMQTQLAELHRALLRLTANDELCRRFMTIPGVGPVTALAFKATIDDPGRFRRSSDVGAHLGLTPRQYHSGETDVRGRISRSGDTFTRTALFTAAHVMLTRSRQWTSIRAWGLRIAKRSSLKKAYTAIAAKMARTVHAVIKHGEPYRPFFEGASPGGSTLV